MVNLLRISEAASLAMHTMVLLAREPERVISTHEIATTLGVSEAHLSKVLQRLARAGLVESTRGPAGGFLPGKPCDDVTLLEVYEAMEGPLTDRTCLFARPVCGGTLCILGDLLGRVNQQVKGYLAHAKLSELAR